MLHYPTPSFSVYITKDNRYSTLTASELFRQKAPLGWRGFLSYGVLKPIKTFFSLFFRHRGYQDGLPGFAFAFYSGLHHISAYLKYWEMKQTNKNTTEKDWI